MLFLAALMCDFIADIRCAHLLTHGKLTGFSAEMIMMKSTGLRLRKVRM